MRLRSCRQQLRRGMAALDVVMITAVTVPIAAFAFWMVVLTVRRFFGMLGVGVGWPYL